MYDFNKITDRTNTDSVKTEELEKNFGKSDLLPLWVADMDIETPDFITRALIQRAKTGLFGYTARGSDYYNAIIHWLETRHSFVVDEAQIEYAPSVMYALNVFIQLFTKRNDKIIIQTPVYYPFFSVVTNNSRQILENALIRSNNSFVIDFDDLEQKAADPQCTMMLLCSPHNPSGRVWTKAELQRIGEICIEHGVLIIADEVHFDLVYEPNKHTVFPSISQEFARNSILCTAPSKTFNIAGLHTAYIVSQDQDRMQQYKKVLDSMDLKRSNCFSRVATEAVYTYGAQWVDELNHFLRSNIDYVSSFCQQHLHGISALNVEGTYLLLLDCRALNLSDDKLDELFVEKAGLALNSGYWFGKEGSGYMRLNVACPRPILEKAMDNLHKALNA